jgi:hypothetical protein
LELSDAGELKVMLGPHWWFHFGAALCEVIMPPDFYKVGPENERRWDTLGSDALARDFAAWPGPPSDDLMLRSQFNLFYDIGVHLFGRRSPEALQFAMNRIARREPAGAVPLDPQLILNLEAAVLRSKKNSSP